MSFELYVQRFQNGEFADIPRQRLRLAFGVHLIESEPDLWQLRYDDTEWCDIYLTAPHDADPSMVQGFTVKRPCGDRRLWDSLASLLALEDAVLYFPGGRAPLVAHSSVTQHLPTEMVEALGQPVVVTSGRDILDEIHAA